MSFERRAGACCMQQETDSLVAFLFSLFPNSQSHRKDKSNQCKKKTNQQTKTTTPPPPSSSSSTHWMRNRRGERNLQDYLYKRKRERKKEKAHYSAAYVYVCTNEWIDDPFGHSSGCEAGHGSFIHNTSEREREKEAPSLSYSLWRPHWALWPFNRAVCRERLFRYCSV